MARVVRLHHSPPFNYIGSNMNKYHVLAAWRLGLPIKEEVTDKVYLIDSIDRTIDENIEHIVYRSVEDNSLWHRPINTFQGFKLVGD